MRLILQIFCFYHVCSKRVHILLASVAQCSQRISSPLIITFKNYHWGQTKAFSISRAFHPSTHPLAAPEYFSIRTNPWIKGIEKKHLHGFSKYGRGVWLRSLIFLNPLATSLLLYRVKYPYAFSFFVILNHEPILSCLSSISSYITYFSKSSVSLSFASSISTLLCSFTRT